MTENTERLKLKVTPGSIARPQEIGEKGARVVRFKAEDEKGNTRVYETWSEELAYFIKEKAEKDEVIPTDISYSEKEGKDGMIYSHWKVIQCYRADGSPVKEKVSRGGGKYYGKSPEERKSIEDQTRAYIIADLWKSGKLDDSNPFVKKLETWLNKLGEPLPAISKGDEPTITKPADKTEPKAKPEPAKKEGFANAGEFLKACLDNLGMNRTDVLEAKNISDISDLLDLNQTYQELAEMKSKPLF